MTCSNPAYEDSYNIKYGYKNLFIKENGEYRQVWHIGYEYRFEKDIGGKLRFIMREAVWDTGESGGYGVIAMYSKPSKTGGRNKIYVEYFKKTSRLKKR